MKLIMLGTVKMADYVGKGGNSTLSMLHHYLENHSIEENDVHLQADNCVG